MEVSASFFFMETFFQNIGFSYTLSKALPYILFFLLGLILFLFIRRKIKSRIAKLLLLLLLPSLMFGGYFLVNPIYEGDFSNNSKKIQTSFEEFSLKEKKIYIVAIPGCPFCMDALQRISIIKSKNPNLNIQFIVCSTDKNSITPYKKSVGKGINFTTSINEKLMNEVANGSFPTFVFSDGKSLKKWRNDDFGVVALDEVIENFEKN